MRGSGEPFDLVGDDPLGVVLIHGFTSTPFEVAYLGRALAARGFSVSAPLLPGHGTSIDDLDRTSWTAWVDAVDDAATRMTARCERVALVGQSLGGLLSLYLASKRSDIACVGTLAAPLWLDGMGRWAAAWTAPGAWLDRVRTLPKLGGSDVRDPDAKRMNPAYPVIPTRALSQLVTFMGVVDAELPKVRQPVLVLHAEQDHTAPVACARYIAARTRAHRIRILPRSYHLLAIDVERDIVAAEVSSFLHAKGNTCVT